jgi:nucleotide-binding universal stress UspA family protein
VIFRRILVAVDASPIAAHATDLAIELARSLGSEVAFIHAINPSVGIGADGGVTPGDLIALEERDGKALLAALGARASLQPPPLEFLKVGKPGAEITRTAAEWGADLLVLGSHGRGGIVRAVLGSVAESVVRHAPCPVLVVRGEHA